MAGYETSVTMYPFRGIRQDGDGENMSLSYAWEAENCDTRGGGLRPVTVGEAWEGELPAPIGTLMRLYRRFYGGTEEKEVLVAAAGKELYTRLGKAGSWERVSGITLQSDNLDWVTYEVNREGDRDPVDVLLMTNEKDGMICLYGDDLHGALIDTPRKFGILARHAERIWGGAVTGFPDKLMYSAPYDPFNWAQNDEIPEDGAGEIDQPSWDGDGFIALRPFGSQLLALKRNRIFRILGTDPGSYLLKEQYGGGTAAENSAVVSGAYVYMLGLDGLLRYDGTSADPYCQREVWGVWDRVNKAALSGACGAVWRDRVYMAVPLDGSEINNGILEYDLREKSCMLRTGVSVKAFLPMEGDLLYTSARAPGRVLSILGGEALGVRWVSGFQDLGAKNVVKSGFTAYLAVEAEQDMTLRVTVETEKRVKTKAVMIRARDPKTRRVRLSGSGRRFRVKLEAEGKADWRLPGGAQLRIETDED